MASGEPMSLDAALRHRTARVTMLAVCLSLVCLIAAALALGLGAMNIAPAKILGILADLLFGGVDPMDRDALILISVRMPRLLLAGLVGAALAVCGALMQGLFRNPLADPGLVGVSSGAALAVALVIVLGDRWLGLVNGSLAFPGQPLAAFVGGLSTMLLLYAIATRRGVTSIATMLLAGIAVQAATGAMTGILTFLSDDRQLRDLTFWSLGSLGGATWSKLAVVAPLIGLVLVVTPFLARGLNAIMMGEAEAYFVGLPVQRIKFVTIAAVALSVGASVAVSGMIAFVGIVVPHALRLVIGPDHRTLLPLSALAGAALLTGADTVSRLVVAPAELPIGIVTAVIGAPFFLWLLLQRDREVGL